MSAAASGTSTRGTSTTGGTGRKSGSSEAVGVPSRASPLPWMMWGWSVMVCLSIGLNEPNNGAGQLGNVVDVGGPSLVEGHGQGLHGECRAGSEPCQNL